RRTAGPLADPCQHLGELDLVGTGVGGRFGGAAQLRGRDELHRGRDLPGLLDPLDAPLDVLQTGHRAPPLPAAGRDQACQVDLKASICARTRAWRFSFLRVPRVRISSSRADSFATKWSVSAVMNGMTCARLRSSR